MSRVAEVRAWPRRLATVPTSIPAVRSSVATKWRSPWILTWWSPVRLRSRSRRRVTSSGIHGRTAIEDLVVWHERHQGAPRRRGAGRGDGRVGRGDGRVGRNGSGAACAAPCRRPPDGFAMANVRCLRSATASTTVRRRVKTRHRSGTNRSQPRSRCTDGREPTSPAASSLSGSRGSCGSVVPSSSCWRRMHRWDC